VGRARSRAIGADLIAGLSIAGLVLPEAFAYASIAALPPQAGVAALVAGIAGYALLGRSRFAIVAATSSSAAVLAAATASLGVTDPGQRAALAAGLVMLTGLILLLAGAARLDALSDLIARPVLRGFAFGLAAVIVLRQLPHWVGLHPEATDAIGLLAQLLGAHWHLPGLVLGAGSLVALAVLSRWPRVPGPLLVLAGAVIVQKLGLTAGAGIDTVGPIALGLAMPAVPALAFDQWLRLGELAVALVFIVYAESQGSIGAFALKHRHTLRFDRELLALGLANLLSGLLRGLPVGAGFSATSANEAAGAQSRLASLAALGFALVLVVVCLPWIALIPLPVLASVVIHAVGATLRDPPFARYFRWHRDRIVVVVACAAVMVLGVLDGLLVSIAASLVMLLRGQVAVRVTTLGRLGTSHDFVPLASDPSVRAIDGMLILRPEMPLFFANADRSLALARARVEAALQDASAPPLRGLVLSLEESPDLDGTAIEALGELARDLATRGVALRLARVKDAAYHALERASLPGLACKPSWKLSVDDAVRTDHGTGG
jgi:MFS superfamily sulfate permease-like transporter